MRLQLRRKTWDRDINFGVTGYLKPLGWMNASRKILDREKSMD